LTPGDGQDVLARYKQAREARDPDRMLALFAEDAEYRSHPFEPVLSGALDLRRHWNSVAADQATVEFDAERVWVAGRTVLSSWHEAYTLRANGERVRVRAFSTFELDEGGLIARLRSWPIERIVATDLPDPDALSSTEIPHG
jgi:ketosteroid isomerase-like protein